MNIVTLIGRLTSDIELKYTTNEKAYAKMRLAVPREFNRDEVDFINCTCWGKTAEIAAEYLRKGNRVGVNGSLRINTYEKDGEKKKFAEVNINNLEFLESKGTSTGITEKNAGYGKSTSTGATTQDNEEMEDIFPFN